MIMSPLTARLIYHTIIIVGYPLAFCFVTLVMVQAVIARWWDALVLRRTMRRGESSRAPYVANATSQEANS